MLVTITDFGPLSDFYHENPILNDKNLESDIILDSSEEIFLSKLDTEKVIIALIRYKIPSDAKRIDEGFKIAATVFDVTYTKTTVPDNFWVGKDMLNDLLAFATYHDVLISLKIENMTSDRPEDNTGFALMLIKNQVTHLEDGGY